MNKVIEKARELASFYDMDLNTAYGMLSAANAQYDDLLMAEAHFIHQMAPGLGGVAPHREYSFEIMESESFNVQAIAKELATLRGI